MKYKEFKVLVLSQDLIIAITPRGKNIKGKPQIDGLRKSTIEIFNDWLAEGKIKKRKELVVLGSYLYGVLFSGEVDTAFNKAFDEVQKQQDTALRVVLEFEPEARELATMPWEYIYLAKTGKEKGSFIATRNKLILTRHVPLTVEAEDLQPREKPLRILIVVSKPKDLTVVKAEPVIDSIEKLKRKSPNAIMTDKLDQPTKRSFTDKVKDFKPHVLHFIGHGMCDEQGGRLAFVQEEDQKSSARIDDIDLADCFQDFQPRLIFLHACEGASNESYEGFSGLALQLVYAKVPAVVAMQYPIKNKMAIKFAKKFYECLGEGKPIDVAVQAGRGELGMYLDEKNFSSRAFGSPVVYLQSAEGIIIADRTGLPPDEKKPPAGETQLVPCPNARAGCPGKVYLTDSICTSCRDELMLCPQCGDMISKTNGICARCKFKIEVSDAESKPGTLRTVTIQGQESIDRKKIPVKVHAPKPELENLQKSFQTGRISALSKKEKSQSRKRKD
ncbi:MAG: CHAT domain-containing protein [Candidatus Hodarchaeota archaeon]